ncbi:uncharacterized protein (DUF1330 family) [Panacagrimonas perspica]|uniref:Uncharacterized protein (DUF1330 family) n=1 Tax=Panacagrimonas perspica TaxID=381431 RepID=A0A4S3K4S3_9GAMM|nr:DUF1330 domain-containing protein [Panacagrimonas perspica]TDU31690.1 uncharacterized protein (DUF1330 family) [Panacagrimonas perspica]THD03095.1 hypothetical protein B1810_10910 [Panacagrimonas perspica]
MSHAYVVGHITVKDPAAWDEYRGKVPGTIAPWNAELVFRGKKAGVLAGANAHTDIVVIRFPTLDAANDWYASAAYQALIPIRERAASIDIVIYEA